MIGAAQLTTPQPSVAVELSVVIPAHNSATLIARTASRLAERLADRTAEVIVVENGSSDGTHEVCEEIARGWTHPTVSFSVLRSERGIGNALRMGAEASRGSRVLLTADDLPFGFDDLDAADRILASGQDLPEVLIGSKAHAQSRAGRGLARATLTSTFSMLRRLILGTRVGDSQGTLLVDGELLRTLAPQVREGGFLFSTELVHVVERMGVCPIEVPVRLDPEHAKHQSRIALSDVAAMGVGLPRLRVRHRGVSRYRSIKPRMPPA